MSDVNSHQGKPPEDESKMKRFSTTRILASKQFSKMADHYEQNFKRLRALRTIGSSDEATATDQQKTVDIALAPGVPPPTGNTDQTQTRSINAKQFEKSRQENDCMEFLRSNQAAPAAGIILSDVYTLLKKIGEGGNGRIYLARDNNLDILCAIKILTASKFSEEESRKKFFMEVKTTAKLRHPNIVNIFYANHIGDYLYYVMEFIQGKTCDEILHQREMTEFEVFQIAVSLAEALRYAHLNNIIHRDIKPANIMIEENGAVKLLDLGLALSSWDKKEDQKLIVGTPFYLAPEQARANLAEIDQRTDIYSFGATLYHMLTNQVPFRGTNVYHTLSLVLNMELQAKSPHEIKPQISDRGSDVVMTCLAKEQSKRFQNMEEVLIAVHEILASLAGKGQNITTKVFSHTSRFKLPQ